MTDDDAKQLREHAAKQHRELERILTFTELLLKTVRGITMVYDGNMPPEVLNTKRFIQDSPLALYRDEYITLVRDQLTSITNVEVADGAKKYRA